MKDFHLMPSICFLEQKHGNKRGGGDDNDKSPTQTPYVKQGMIVMDKFFPYHGNYKVKRYLHTNS